MTDPIAPDALREAVQVALVEHQRVYHSDWGHMCICGQRGQYGEMTFAASAIHQADAVLAEVAKHRDAEVREAVKHHATLLAEVERLRAVVDFQRTRGDLAFATSDSIRADRDAAHDRIARALAVVNKPVPDERDFTASPDYYRGAMDAHEHLVGHVRAILTGTDQEPG